MSYRPMLHTLAGPAGVLCLCSFLGGCPAPEIPDQSQFKSLFDLAESGEAVARVYGAPIPGLEALAIHTWIVVKRPDDSCFHRWEVWQVPGGPFAHVRCDLQSPEGDVGVGGTFIIGELVGAKAEPIVAFVEGQSPAYSYPATYLAFPGPNSNTYIQWVLDEAEWELVLPESAIGAWLGSRSE